MANNRRIFLAQLGGMIDDRIEDLISTASKSTADAQVAGKAMTIIALRDEQSRAEIWLKNDQDLATYEEGDEDGE